VSARATARIAEISSGEDRQDRDLHRQLLRLVIEEGGLEDVLRRAAVVLREPVGLALDGRCVFASPTGNLRALNADEIPRDIALPVHVGCRTVAHVWYLGDRGAPQPLASLALVIALIIKQREDRRAAQRSQVDELLHAMICEGHIDEVAISARASSLGLDLPARVVVMRVRPSPGSDVSSITHYLVSRLELLAVARGRDIAVIVDGDRVDEIPALTTLITGAAHARIGVGNVCPLAKTRQSFDEAERALRIGSLLDDRRDTWRFGDVAHYDVLFGGIDRSSSKLVIARVLGPLSAVQVETLRTYLGVGMSVTATARELALHRNSVHHRLSRIETLTHLNLSRPEDRLLCEIALVADRWQSTLMQEGRAETAPGSSAARTRRQGLPRSFG
jgi:sugar diacid utilization regulator